MFLWQLHANSLYWIVMIANGLNQCKFSTFTFFFSIEPVTSQAVVQVNGDHCLRIDSMYISHLTRYHACADWFIWQ